MERKIRQYIKTWENRCYPDGIPDEAPFEIHAKVPSYKRIALAILNNDHSLKSLGLTPKKSEYYNILKRKELNLRKITKMENMTIPELSKLLAEKIKNLQTEDEKIDTLNEVRLILHQESPLKHHPVDYVFWKKSDEVEANEYNPNAVAPPEMLLLYESISNDGYTMPIVSFPDEDTTRIVDGFHRRETERRNKDISASTLGRVPLTSIRTSQRDSSDRMASTIRHNRARGSHNIELMSQIVSELVEMGKGDPWICKHIGMSPDELLRMKQITGLASLFQNKSFSESWTVEGEADFGEMEVDKFEDDHEF